MRSCVSDTRRAVKAALARESDPVELALGFLGQDLYFHLDGPDPMTAPAYYLLRKWRGDYYLWKDGVYHPVTAELLTVHLTGWLQGEQKRLVGTLGESFRITRELIGNVRLNLDPHVLIRPACEPNSWLDLEAHPPVVALRNGLLELAELGVATEPTLRPPTPNYFNLARLDVAYTRGADCPRWRRLLDEALDGRAELIELLARWVGYLLWPDLRQQKFLLCVGEGANGKGVFFEVVQALLGHENCAQVPLARFVNPFALTATLGKLLNATSESARRLDEQAESQLKAFVAGDRMTFERKYRDPICAVPTAKLMIATNVLPRFADKTQGLWRRVLLVPFDRSIPESQQNRTLAAELIATELPGILNWALEGLTRLNAAGGFDVPAVSRRRLEAHRRDVDPARTFLLDNFTASFDDDGLPACEVYQQYVVFCEANGYRPTNAATLGRQVKRTFPTTAKVRRRQGRRVVTVYRGLTVIDGSDVATGQDVAVRSVRGVRSKSL